ncbi:MAG: AMP-binding protein [Nitrospinota bacterium]|nr:AMP-binding protein [Nitrospinota bacterium]
MALEFYRFIKTHARNQPDHPAIIDGETTVTYAQLLEQVERFAGGLDSLAINPDSKLGLLCLNQKEYLIALLGALLKGLPVVPYNFMLTPEDLIYITQDAGVDHLVINPAFIKPETAPFFSKFKTRITTSPAPDSGLPIDGTIPFEHFLQSAQPDKAQRRHSRTEGIPDVIMYTSGTTAKPKGVMLNESMFDINSKGVEAHLPLQPADRAIMALPLFHSFGNMIALLILRVGATLILLPQFQPKSILTTIARHQATVLPLVPTIYSFLVQLVARGDYDVSSLRYCISGGAALPQALLHKVEEVMKVTVLEGYGLTETSPVIAVNTIKGGSIVGSVGPVLPGVELKIVDEQGQAVPQGDVGEIFVKGATVTPGYWKLPEENREALTADGWFKTGDLGHLDAQGRLYISAGRKKDLIIRAGENVAPLAIENVLINHPALMEAAAVGIPHQRLGEQVVACVVLGEGQQATESELKKYCQEKLPPFSIPDRFQFYETLPKNPVGKILKTQLREEVQAALNPT